MFDWPITLFTLWAFLLFACYDFDIICFRRKKREFKRMV